MARTKGHVVLKMRHAVSCGGIVGIEVLLMGAGYIKYSRLGAWRGGGGPWSPELSKHTPVKGGKRPQTDSGRGSIQKLGGMRCVLIRKSAQRTEGKRGQGVRLNHSTLSVLQEEGRNLAESTSLLTSGEAQCGGQPKGEREGGGTLEAASGCVWNLAHKMHAFTPEVSDKNERRHFSSPEV